MASDGLSRSRINWSQISEVDFNQVVEVLLLKMYDKKPYMAEVLRGAGGDGGIDVAVRLKDRVVKIFQLKYFPEGFTGGFRDSRRPQIRKSFETAWKNHSPEEWILVMPPDPHQNERDFVNGFASEKNVAVDIWGQEKLAAALTDYPEVERAFLRDELVDVLRLINQEKAGLVGSSDFADRIGDLLSLANTRSKYWDTTVTTHGDVVFEDYVAKHPDAMEKEPIHTQLRLSLGPEHRAVAEQLQDNLAYGLLDNLDVPGSAASLIRTGPAWVAPLPQMEIETVRLLPQALKKPGASDTPPITMNVLDAHGFIKGRYEGRVTRRAKGTLGATIKCQFLNVVTLVFKLPWSRDVGDSGCHLAFDASGGAVRDVYAAMRMLQILRAGNKIELYSNGGRLASLVLNAEEEFGGSTDEWTESLVDDLYGIEQSLGDVSFTVPDQTTRLERVQIRVARILLDGYMTVMPPGRTMTVTLSGEIDEGLERLLREGGAIWSRQPTTAIEILGGRYDLGGGHTYHPNVKVADGERILEDLKAGRGAGEKVQLEAADGSPFRIWLQKHHADEEGRPEYKPWGIPTIEDPTLEGASSVD